MNKELYEAIDNLWANLAHTNYTENYSIRDRNLLIEAVERLEAIDNAKPSEALKGLKHIRKYYVPQPCSAKTYDYLEIIEQALLKAQGQEKVLDVIWKKNVDIALLNASSLLEDYNSKVMMIYGYTFSVGRLLTQEEFNLLKRC